MREDSLMRVAIVGSRKFLDKNAVVALVDALDATDTVVSGGCKGVDTWAETAAKNRGLKVQIFRPNLKGTTSRHEATKRYYERNRDIVANCDTLHAFLASGITGGTGFTVKEARARGIEVFLHS